VLSLKLIYFTTLLILEYLHRLKTHRRFKNKALSPSHINLSKLVNLLTFALFFPSLHIVLLGLLLLSPYSCHSLISRLKIANSSLYHSAPVLWNNLPSDIRHIAHHVTSSPTLNSPVSDLSTSPFLTKLKTHFFHCSFPPHSVFT